MTQCRQSSARKNRSHATVTIAQNCDLPDSRHFGTRPQLYRRLQNWSAIAVSTAFLLFRCIEMPTRLHAICSDITKLHVERLSMQQIRLCLAEVASMVQSIVRQVQTLCMNAGCSEAARLAMQR
jgi:hypothetical protein